MKVDKSDFQEIRHLFIKTKDVDSKNQNLIWATVSTDEVDRYDEIVLPSAIKEALPSFIANPVVLAAHQHTLPTADPPVIGNVVTDTIQIKEHNIDLAILFDDDELSQKYANKYRKKFMRAFSIGFRGLEGKFEQITDTVKNIIRKVWTWTLIELLEVSAVAVPANRTALLIAAGYYEGMLQAPANINTETIKELLSAYSSNVEKNVLDLKSFIEQSLNEIKSLLIADRGELAQELLIGEVPVEHSACDDQIAAEKLLETLRS